MSHSFWFNLDYEDKDRDDDITETVTYSDINTSHHQQNLTTRDKGSGFTTNSAVIQRPLLFVLSLVLFRFTGKVSYKESIKT